MQISFENKTILVTGGTRGIGKSLVELFLSLGATVIFTGRNYLSRPLDSNEIYYQVDFSVQPSVDKFIKKIENHDIDVLVNNAGINAINPISSFRDSDWDDILAVNLTSPYRLMKAVSERMKEKRSGKIINVSSIYGLVGKSFRAGYCSSKHGLRGLTAAAAAELAQFNVLVNAVAPGFTLTDLTTEILGPEGINKVSKTVPIGRLAKPEEIAKAIIFLSSDLNTYISGQTITVDGGFTNV
jgi:NAD(P)-dependent dehydrogenase (short-subunit alcohol dehydrogenase family)